MNGDQEMSGVPDDPGPQGDLRAGAEPRATPVITSVRNDRVVAAAGLSSKKRRDATGTYLVEGQHPVAEVVADGLAEVVFATQDRVDQVQAMSGADAVEVVVVEDHVMERLADARTPQGMVAVARQRRGTVEDAVAGAGVAVLLVAANDPGNVGAVIRTADAAGAAGVVLTAGSCDPFNPKAVRAAAGSTSHLAIAIADDPVAVVVAARAAGRRTVALDAAGDLDLLAAGPHPGGDLLVVGSEAHGLPDEVVAAVDAVGFVPIRGRAESLNLAAATAVALYAVTGG